MVGMQAPPLPGVSVSSYRCVTLYLFSFSVYMPRLPKKPVNSPRARTLSLIFSPTTGRILELEAVFAVPSCRHPPLLYTEGNCGP